MNPQAITPPRTELLGEPAGALAERQVHRRVEEVIDFRVLQRIADEGRLAGLPWAKEEMGPLREQGWQVEHAGDPLMALGIYWRIVGICHAI